MPHRVPTFFCSLAEMLECYKEHINLTMIILLVELGGLLNFGGKWRKALGEGLICLVCVGMEEFKWI